MTPEITIEPLFTYTKGLRSRFNIQKHVIVQSETFKLGLKVTNVGKQPIHLFTIKNIRIKPADNGHNIDHPFAKEYVVGPLNPKDYKVLEISDFGTDFYGLACIELVIVPTVEEQIITANQISRFNSEEEGSSSNRWADFFFIKSSHENTQEKTNSLLLWLSLVVAAVTLLPFIIALLQLNKYAAVNSLLIAMNAQESHLKPQN